MNKKPKTRLKWTLHKEDNWLAFDAALIVKGKHYYALYIGLEKIAPNKVRVQRIIWQGTEESPLYEHMKTHRGTIEDFIREFPGLEYNLLIELNSHLEMATKKVNALLYPADKVRP